MTLAPTERAHTSDEQARPNGFTREGWLHAILYSGEVTRIGQHLALVIYHLADPATNTAKLSARDLERITGWSRTAIIDHLAEIETFIRVTWGAGRAKSIFELQGIIAEAIEAQRVASQPDATADATNTTQADTNSCVRDVATTADTKVDTSPNGSGPASIVDATADTTACGQPGCHSSVSQPDTKAEKANEGGTIGGETRTTVENPKHTHTQFRAQAPEWMVSEDGGFEGKVFELSGLEVAAIEQAYAHLEWPGDLVAADQFFARKFDRMGQWPELAERLAGLHAYLAKRNREAVELVRMYEKLAAGRAGKTRKPAQPIVPEEAPSAWFDKEGRLQVANGFRVGLLEMVGGDESRLREELDEAGGWVGTGLTGLQLLAKVRSRIVSQAKHSKGRSSVVAGPTKTTRIRGMVEDAVREQEQKKAGRRQV